MSTSGVGPRSRVSQQQQAQQSQQHDHYTVRSGDNLTHIARDHGVSLDALIAANPQIKDPNLIHPGQVLNLPGNTQRPGAAGGSNGANGTSGAGTTGTTGTGTTQAPGNQGHVTPDGYTTSQQAPQPQTQRPATQPFAAIPVTDPQAQAQLQQQLHAVRQQSGQSGTGGWTTRDASSTGANELNPRTRNGFNVGNNTTGISGQNSGQSWSTSVTRTNGQTERNQVTQNQGYGRDALAQTQERSTTTRNGETVREHDQTAVRDRRGNQLVESSNTTVDKDGNRTQARSSSSTVQDGDNRRVSTDRQSTTTNRQGQVTQESLEEHRTNTNTRSGRTTGHHTIVRQSNGGHLTEDVVDVHKDGRTRAAERIAGHTEASATIAAVETRSNWHGVATARSEPIGTGTGAEGEVHALAVQGSASAAAGINLKEGRVAAGAQAGVAVDLIGASGRAQVGDATTAAGQGYVKGEAHVGANARIGGGVEIDPRRLTAKVGVGGEAFAGAEIKGSAGYQNRWFGAEVEARGQAGAGVAGRAEIGLDRGNLKVKADLGACVGLGGRVTVNVNVNLKAIYDDTKDTVVAAAQSVANTAVNTYNTVSNAVSSTVSGAVDGAKSMLSSGWKTVSSWF